MSALNIAINIVGTNLAGGAFSSLAGNINRTSFLANDLKKGLDSLNTSTLVTGAGALGAAIAFGGFFAATKLGFQGAVDLEAELLQLRQALQVNQDAMPVLTQSVNDLGIKTVYSSAQAADAFTLLVRSGFSASQVMYGAGAAADEYKSHAYNATEATRGLGFEALALGQLLGVSANDGATLAATAVHLFSQEVMRSHDPTKAADGVVNDLAGAFQNVSTSGPDMLSFLQQAGPTAASMGIHFQDLMTTADVLGQHFGNLSVTGTRMRYFLQTLIHPTTQQARELASLGLWTVSTGSAFKDFEARLVSAGGASRDNIKHWTGSVTGLQEMFKAAQKVGLVPLDKNFGDWAAQTGFLNSKLYDSHGNLRSLKDIIDTLQGSLKGMTSEEKNAALANLFNVRGGDVGRTLAALDNFDAAYARIQNRIKNTSAVDLAMQRLGTFKGAWEAFTDTVKSVLAVAFLGLLPPITGLINHLNNLMSVFLNAPPQVQKLLGIFLLAGTIVSGLTAAFLGVATIVALVGPALAGLGISLGAVAAAFFLVPVAILAVAAAITLLIMFFHNGGSAARQVGHVLHELAGFFTGIANVVKSELGPVFSALGAQVRGPLLSAWNSLKSAFITLLPVFKILAVFIGVIVVTAIGVFLAILVGLISAIAHFVAGMIVMFAGVAQAVAGFVRLLVDLFSGLGTMLQDILSGNWSKLGSDARRLLGNLKNDVVTIFHGIITAVAGLFEGLTGLVGGFISGFVNTVVGWFKHLSEVLVGHSIVPDMITAIVRVFTELPGRVMGVLGGFVSGVIGKFAQLGAQLLSTLGNLPGPIGGFFRQIANSADHESQRAKTQAILHAAEMKAGVLTHVAEEHLQAAAHYKAEADECIREAAHAKDQATRNALEKKAGVLNAMSAEEQGAAQHAINQRNQVVEQARQMAAQSTQQSASMKTGVLANLQSMAAQAGGAARQLASNVLSALSGLAGQLVGVGRNMISGLIGGIKSMAGAAAGAIGGVVSGAVNAAKSALGINSPSRVFHEFGTGTIQGYINGLVSASPHVQATVDRTLAIRPPALSVTSLGVLGAQATGGWGASPANANQQPINIYVGNKLVARAVLDHATGRLKQSGVSRMGR